MCDEVFAEPEARCIPSQSSSIGLPRNRATPTATGTLTVKNSTRRTSVALRRAGAPQLIRRGAELEASPSASADDTLSPQKAYATPSNIIPLIAIYGE